MGASEVSGQTAGLYGIGCGRRGSPAREPVWHGHAAPQQALKQSQRTDKSRFVWSRCAIFAEFGGYGPIKTISRPFD